MKSAARCLELSLLPERFAIARLAGDRALPTWATGGSLLSVVCELGRVPVDVSAQPSWRVFKVHGPFVLTEIGVLSALAVPLADAKISLFAISTFDTDYLLVESATLSAAIAALELAGHKIHRSHAE